MELIGIILIVMLIILMCAVLVIVLANFFQESNRRKKILCVCNKIVGVIFVIMCFLVIGLLVELGIELYAHFIYSK